MLELPKIIIDYSCYSNKFDYNNFNWLNTNQKWLKNLTNKSTMWTNYKIFLYEVHIPFEFLCTKIIKDIEEKFIHIPLVKTIVKKSFTIDLYKPDSNARGRVLEASFINSVVVSNFFDYRLNFSIILKNSNYFYNSIPYDFHIEYNFQIESGGDYLSLFKKNFKKLDSQLLNRFKEKFSLNEFSSIDSTYPKSRFSTEIGIDEHNIAEHIYKGFEKFLVLSLLATSENPMNEINDIWNNDGQEKSNQDMDTEENYLEETTLNHYIKTLKRKKQIIFQGSPGTGKTYLAKHIAQHLTSSGDGFFELIQFHPTYSYEDFIQGIRPQTSPDGNLEYSLIPGRFLDFCKKAETCQDICILIIDEINRTNLSQVFGELMYLLEYREEEINLAGSNQPFKIPENVYIIGTMNTADRSIALVDHALRRRFAFITIKPNYEILRKYHEKHNPNFPTDNLINILENLNQTINDPHYEIGVSFFLTQTLEADIQDIWTMEIEPYLEEYFFDETDKIDQFSWDKIKSKLGFNYDSQ